MELHRERALCLRAFRRDLGRLVFVHHRRDDMVQGRHHRSLALARIHRFEFLDRSDLDEAPLEALGIRGCIVLLRHCRDGRHNRFVLVR